jgi:NTE family protein
MIRSLVGGVVAFGAIALGLTACGGHTTNEPLCGPSAAEPCTYQPARGYRFDPTMGEGETLIVVTFSGGGVRASALAYGTLQALADLDAPGGAKLLDRVDIISSVSGGSVTAGWYALHGRDGLKDDARFQRFLYDDNMSALALRGLNPLALAGYLVADYQRSDVLADYFARRLFDDKRYADVAARYRPGARQPFVIVNATDLGHETGFGFTQNRFDLLCSDLSLYRLADAVAASANFPVVFSPIGLRNHAQGCRARDARWLAAGPPQWIDSYKSRYDSPFAGGAEAKRRASDGLLQLRAARTASDYLDSERDRVVHLLDGGLVDNLGVQSVLAIEDEAVCTPGLFQRLSKPRPPAYQRIKQVLFIVVNARSRTPASIDGAVAPPDAFSTLLRVIDTPVDSTIVSTQHLLTAVLQAYAQRSSGFSPERVSPQESCWCEPPADPTAPSVCKPGAAVPDEMPFKYGIVSIDFEMIPNKPCRDKFWELSTSWSLPAERIRELQTLPRIMLQRSLELRQFYKDRKMDADTAGLGNAANFPTDFSSVCS